VQRAVALAAPFVGLANDTRLRRLHALSHADELCVSEFAAEIGASIQALSNQPVAAA
jgi:DNA-binding transcriptional ArsR family regulator